MIWLIFIISAALIVYAATQLAKYGDAIALGTGLGGMLVGVILLAGATSLPEVLTSISSLQINAPDLAAGNLLGSSMVNMFLLAVMDMLHHKARILRSAALKHALSGSLAILLAAAVVTLVMADIPIRLGWVGLDSVIIILLYIAAVRLLHHNTPQSLVLPDIPSETPGLIRALLGFGLASALLVVVTPIMVQASSQIAEITGLGDTFVGTTLVALVTSLPELVTTLAAVKIGAHDMAIGNLFGSNLFNMFALGLTDIFYTPGRFLAVIDPAFLLVGMLGLVMTCLALIGNLIKLEKRILFVELDAFLLILVYFGGLWLLYSRG